MIWYIVVIGISLISMTIMYMRFMADASDTPMAPGHQCFNSILCFYSMLPTHRWRQAIDALMASCAVCVVQRSVYRKHDANSYLQERLNMTMQCSHHPNAYIDSSDRYKPAS